MALTILVGGYTSMITALTFSAGLSGGTGSLSILSQSTAGTNPSWIALNPTNSSILYAGQENYNGQILSFIINSSTAKLTQVGTVGTGGQNPAFFLPLFTGTEIIAANYNSGTTGDILLGADRSLLPSSAASTVTYTGSGPNASRQTSSHPHEVIEYIINQELLVSDLGADKVWRLNRSPSTGNWQVADFVQQPLGSGPRHMAVSGNNLYVVHELSNTLTQQTLPVLGSGQSSQFIATQSIIPPGASNTTLAGGELLISTVNCMFPKEYLYATNRNDPNAAGDAISIFSTNPLTLVAQVRTGLQGLRGAALGGPNGEYLVVGGQTSGGVVLYERTNGGASLTELGRISSVSQPSTFVILPKGQPASLCMSS